jgi:hypothetical protein
MAVCAAGAASFLCVCRAALLRVLESQLVVVVEITRRICDLTAAVELIKQRVVCCLYSVAGSLDALH